MALFRSFRFLIFPFLIFLLPACEPKKNILDTFNNFKNTFIERTKAKLSDIPFIRRYIKLPPPPKELYEKTKIKVDELKVSRAKDLYPNEYQNLIKKWEKAKSFYHKKYYSSAEKLLQEIQKEGDSLLTKVAEYEANLRNKALSEYKNKEAELLSMVSSKEKDKYLKVKLYLWKLKNLIEMGEYEKFERELKNSPL
ncbi:MAG: hypothetical protein ACP5KO_03485 [Caldimicrobium sp.]